MTSATNLAILSACAALVTAGCARKPVLSDPSADAVDQASATGEEPRYGYVDVDPGYALKSSSTITPSFEERVRVAMGAMKKGGSYSREIFALEDQDALLSIEALFSAMRGLVNDPARWFQQLNFSARDEVLLIGEANQEFLWVVVFQDDVSIGRRAFSGRRATAALYRGLIEVLWRVCDKSTGGTEPDGVLGSQRETPDQQLATTIDFSCGPVTVELHGVRGSNKCSLDLIPLSESPLRKSANELTPK